MVNPPLFYPPVSPLLSYPSLILSAPLWNDLRCYNYWVISTVITLNICSVTMLRAFGCARRQLFYVLTVLWCRQNPLQPSTPDWLLALCAIRIREMKCLLYEREQYGGMICCCLCMCEREKRGGLDWSGSLSCRFGSAAVSWGQRSADDLD